MVRVTDIWNRIYNQGDNRTVKAKRNILQMLFLKGGTILVGLLLVPLTLNYVDAERYGIWLTLSSMVAWMSFFDIGINNGLKNRLAESIATNDTELGRKYVSTTYASMVLIFIPLMIVLFVLNKSWNWNKILNINVDVDDLSLSINIIIAYFCVNFVFSTINVVLLADQRPAKSSLIKLLQDLLTMIVILIMTLTIKGSLTNLCLAYCLSPLIIVILANILFFCKRYSSLSPSIKFVDFKVLPNLLKLGGQFFVIQIAGIIQFQMINFIIIRYYGAAEVSAYNISYKYFSVLTLVWGIFTTPIWVGVTDAMASQDFVWIKSMIKKYLTLLCGFIIVGILMFIISPFIYNIWIGEKVYISPELSFWILIFNMSMMFGGIFVQTLNGAGLLKVQMYACAISPLVFLLICWTFINVGIGIYGIIIASIISNFNGIILAPLQYHYFKKRFFIK